MKKTSLSFILLLSLATLVSCNFSKGIFTKPAIGLSYSYNGFRVKDVNLYNTDRNNPLKSKEFKIGQVLLIDVEELTGFTVENDRIYPGCEVTVTDPDGNIALHSSDLYENESGYSSQERKFIVTIVMADPIVAGKDYKTTIRFFDKKNPDQTLDIAVKSKVVD